MERTERNNSPLTHRAIIGLGSNVVGSRREAIERAIDQLKELSTTVVVSDIYETRPWGKAEEGPSYRNAVAGIDTALSLDELKTSLKDYEMANGRDEASRKEGRVSIDLDIVVWDGVALRPHEIERDYFTIGYRQIIEQQEDDD